MKTDAQLKSDVTDELTWDPAVNATHIGVMVENGVVTLTGHLDSFAEKHAVEHAVRRVPGVGGIAMELDVRLAPAHRRTDSEIAQAAVEALRASPLVPQGRVKAEVESGWVTLTGHVDWGYEYAAAEQCIRPLPGVRGVFNELALKERVKSDELARQITGALTRHATREARHIGIEIEGGVVTLSGKVDSLADHDAALGVVSSTHGVSRVIDHLRVGG